MMKKAVLILLCLTIALLAMIGGLLARPEADIVGIWTGYTFVGDGARADFVFTVEKGDEGLTGKITNEAGLIPEIICRNMAFAENKLTFDIDFPQEMGTVLIKVSLVLDGDTLKGSWTNPEDGSSDVAEFARKK